jgi:hypothetical protein
MAKRTILLGGAALILAGISVAVAQPDNSCTTYNGQMSGSALYVLMACPDNAKAQCAAPVNAGTIIQKGVNYRFLYKTRATEIQNSLVVVQLKAMAAQPVPEPVAIKLTRQQLNFACYTKDNKQDPIPADADDVTAAPDVGYSIYDRFHRYGYAPRKELRVLLSFHTSYFNGSACVSTLEKVRRAQFLFADRSNVAGITVGLLTRFGIDTPVAVAAEINHYDHLQVVLANYKKQPQASGCISFLGRSDGPSLEIDVSDLEEKAHASNDFDRFHPEVFTINTK